MDPKRSAKEGLQADERLSAQNEENLFQQLPVSKRSKIENLLSEFDEHIAYQISSTHHQRLQRHQH